MNYAGLINLILKKFRFYRMLTLEAILNIWFILDFQNFIFYLNFIWKWNKLHSKCGLWLLENLLWIKQDRAWCLKTSTSDDNVKQVKKMILENHRIAIREIADDFGLSVGYAKQFFWCFSHKICSHFGEFRPNTISHKHRSGIVKLNQQQSRTYSNHHNRWQNMGMVSKVPIISIKPDWRVKSEINSTSSITCEDSSRGFLQFQCILSSYHMVVLSIILLGSYALFA